MKFPRIPVLRAATLAALVVALGPIARAQDLGRGSLGSGGVLPRLQVRSAPVGKSFELRAQRLSTASNTATWFLISPLSGELPLDGLGVPGAVLGLDLATLFLLGPVPVDTQGTAVFQAKVPMAWDGIPLFVQVMQYDPAASSGLVFSDSRSLTLGSDAPELVLTRNDSVAGRIRLVRSFPSGKPGTPVHDLRDLRLLDLGLASIDEARALRTDLPRPCTIDGARGLRLPDGSTILAYEKVAGQRHGLCRVHADGRIERVYETGSGLLMTTVAASTERLAFVGGAPARLHLLRLDGEPWPGSARYVRDVTPAAGLRLEPDALCVGAKVLAYSDRNQGMWLISLADGQAKKVVMPRVGSAAPVAFDEEIAISGDGRVFALGAGPTRKIKDIVVVKDDGTAINVSNKPTDYAEVGYGNPGRRTDIALNHDGSTVSFVDEGGNEPEGFVTRTVTPAPVQITTTTAFVDSIDIGSTSRMPKTGGGLVFAGLDDKSLDVFFTPGLSDKDMKALTRTAPSNQMPFAKDAKLAVLDLASLPGSHPYLLRARHATRGPLLYVVDTKTATAREALQGDVLTQEPLGQQGKVLIGDAKGLLLVDSLNTTASYVQRLSGVSGAVSVLSVDAGASRAGFLVQAAGGTELWRAEFGTNVTTLRLGREAFGDVFAGHVSGSVHALSAPRSQGGRELLVWNDKQGLLRLGGEQLRAFVQR